MSCAGFWLYGPAWPKPLREQYTRRGFIARTASKPSPQSPIVPGRKFSTRMSASGIMRRRIARPSSSCMLRVMLRLLRLMTRKKLPVSPIRGGDFRKPSPPFGFSILITSAPRSARTWVHSPPGSTCERSSTRVPSRGKVMNTLLISFTFFGIARTSTPGRKGTGLRKQRKGTAGREWRTTSSSYGCRRDRCCLSRSRPR